jgi:sarcosine oxidase
MAASFDVVIVGGGVIGCSAAYHLLADGRPVTVAVIERDPSYEFASTPRSAGGIRQQFSLPENVLMSQYGLGFYRRFAATMATDGHVPDVGLRQGGYLFLATDNGAADLRASHATQTGLGAPVELLDRDALARRFPSLNLDGIALGTFGPEDGWMDPHAILMGFRRKARSLGASFVHDEATGLTRAGGRVSAVTLRSGGNLAAGTVIVAAGAWSAVLCATVGIPLPVEPVRRMAHYFEIRQKLEPLPLTIDPSGAYFRPEGAGYIAGKSNPDEPAGVNFEIDPAWFDEVVWPAIAARVPAFEALKPGRAWAGLYDLNRLDGNLIIGDWPGEIANLLVACGLSGHGLQQAPAIGRALAELVLDGRFVTLDLSRLSYARVMANRPLLERGIV